MFVNDTGYYLEDTSHFIFCPKCDELVSRYQREYGDQTDVVYVCNNPICRWGYSIIITPGEKIHLNYPLYNPNDEA